MKILILCSANTTMKWEKYYCSADFDEAQRFVCACEAEKISCRQNGTNGRPVYVSTRISAYQTAQKLFTDPKITEEALLDEIPVRSYKDTSKKLALWKWKFMAGLQRLTGSSRQPESRRQSAARAEALIAFLEERGQDCILVSHPHFIKVLLNRLRKHGYCVDGAGPFAPAPLDRILITRRDMHCGGCGHNCLLSNPGCTIGQEAARRREKKR